MGVSFYKQGLGVTMVTRQRDDVTTSKRVLCVVGIFSGVEQSSLLLHIRQSVMAPINLLSSNKSLGINFLYGLDQNYETRSLFALVLTDLSFHNVLTGKQILFLSLRFIFMAIKSINPAYWPKTRKKNAGIGRKMI